MQSAVIWKNLPPFQKSLTEEEIFQAIKEKTKLSSEIRTKCELESRDPNAEEIAMYAVLLVRSIGYAVPVSMAKNPELIKIYENV